MMKAGAKPAVVYGMVEQGAAIGDVHVNSNQSTTAGGGILNRGRHRRGRRGQRWSEHGEWGTLLR